MTSPNSRTSLIVVFELDTVRESDAHGENTAEGDLLHGLDRAYDYGHLPSDASWGVPVQTSLPDGWYWSGGPAHAAFCPSKGMAVCSLHEGVLRIHGDVPTAVAWAVLAAGEASP